MRRAALLAVLAAACGGDDTVEPPVGDLPAAPRCAIDLPADTPLATAGSLLMDDQLRLIALRGVNAGGRSKYAPYAPFDFPEGGYAAALDAYLDRAASWGIDVLRVPFSWNAAEPVKGQYDEAYLARYDALLDGAWKRRIWTLIDLHQDVYAEPFCGDGFPTWTLPGEPGPPRHDCENWYSKYETSEVRAAFDAFWSDATGVRTAYMAMLRMLVDRHSGRLGVLGYEPINEPHPGTADPTTWAQTTLTAFYNDVAALVAERDPGALVFLDTTAFDGVLGDTSLARPSGDHLVLAPHSYDPLALFGGDLSEDVDERLLPWAEKGRSWQMPTLIGETGVVADHPFAGDHVRRTLDALDQLGIHGTWWEYSVTADVWNHEVLSVVRADGSETPMAEALARPYARALAGTRVSSAYDAMARRFTIEYTQSGESPTEIAVPTRGTVRVGARGACVDIQAGRVLVRADGGASVALAVEIAAD